ncbi:hypothetical protein [Nocardiopsis sp. ATB16-24]|nr:hypothetical protein [Nocardiopsis sp. ATB16-24]
MVEDGEVLVFEALPVRTVVGTAHFQVPRAGGASLRTDDPGHVIAVDP